MAAQVESMMYAGEVPWHGIGTSVSTEVNSETAIRLAGLDWRVETAPIVTNDQKRTGVDKYRVTRRVTDNTILGVVKNGYVPIQNSEAFQMFDNVLGANAASYHTAGSLMGGSRVFITAKLREPLIVGKDLGLDDPVDKYILLSNAHDGGYPLQMLFTPIRVVCSNTLSIALGKGVTEKDKKLGGSPRVAVHHTKNAQENLKQAERTMARALKWYERFGDFTDFLVRKRVGPEVVDNIISAVFPSNMKGEVTPRVRAHRGEVERLFEEGKGHERIGGTAWALFNAFTEYADHGYAVQGSKTAEERSFSVLIGGAKGLKNRATKAIVQSLAA